MPIWMAFGHMHHFITMGTPRQFKIYYGKRYLVTRQLCMHRPHIICDKCDNFFNNIYISKITKLLSINLITTIKNMNEKTAISMYVS
jgi:hypothetical protein